MLRWPIDKYALVSIYCAIVSVHALGPIIPPGAPQHTVTGAFAALAGLFALIALLDRIGELPVRRIDER